jgi:tmRNA-binding protein
LRNSTTKYQDVSSFHPCGKHQQKTPERLFKLLLHRQVLKEKYNEIASKGYEVPGKTKSSNRGYG